MSGMAARAPRVHDDERLASRWIANCGPVPAAVFRTAPVGAVTSHRLDTLLARIPDLPPALLDALAAVRAQPPGAHLPAAFVADVATLLRERLRCAGASPMHEGADHEERDAAANGAADAASLAPHARDAGDDAARDDARYDGTDDGTDDERRAVQALVALRETLGVPRLVAHNVLLARRERAAHYPLADPGFPEALDGDDPATVLRRLQHIAVALVLDATCAPPLVTWHRTPSPSQLTCGERLVVTVLGPSTP